MEPIPKAHLTAPNLAIFPSLRGGIHACSTRLGYLPPPPGRQSHVHAVVPDIKCVTLSACNVVGTNLLGFYNMSELNAVGTTDLKQVRIMKDP